MLGSGTTGGSDKSSETDSTRMSEEAKRLSIDTGIPNICMSTHALRRKTVVIKLYLAIEPNLHLMHDP